LDSARPPSPPFGVFLKKNSFFFLMPPLSRPSLGNSPFYMHYFVQLLVEKGEFSVSVQTVLWFHRNSFPVFIQEVIVCICALIDSSVCAYSDQFETGLLFSLFHQLCVGSFQCIQRRTMCAPSDPSTNSNGLK